MLCSATPRRHAVTTTMTPKDISALFTPLNECRLTLCATHRGSKSRAHGGAPATSCTHHTAALRAFNLRTFRHAPFSVISVKRHDSLACCNLSPVRTYKRTLHGRPTDTVLIQQYKHVPLPPVQATTAYGWLSANTAPLIQVSGQHHAPAT